MLARRGWGATNLPSFFTGVSKKASFCSTKLKGLPHSKSLPTTSCSLSNRLRLLPSTTTSCWLRLLAQGQSHLVHEKPNSGSQHYHVSHYVCLLFFLSAFYSLLYSYKNASPVKAVLVFQLTVEPVSRSPQGKPISRALGRESFFFSLAFFFIGSLALCNKTFKDLSPHGSDLLQSYREVWEQNFICMYKAL